MVKATFCSERGACAACGGAKFSKRGEPVLEHDAGQGSSGIYSRQPPVADAILQRCLRRSGRTNYVPVWRPSAAPVRRNHAQWSGIIPGDSSATLWNDTLKWRELPRTINPPGGFVQNSNEPPWFSTFPGTIRQSDYPSYIAPNEMEFRPQHGAIFLSSKTKFSTSEVTTGKMSTRMIMADRILPDLISAARESGDADASAAADVLEKWDRESDAGSQGAVLFERWYNLYIADSNSPKDDRWGPTYPAFRVEFSPASALTTPMGLKNPAAAVPFLAQAARELQKQFGRLDIPWGDVYRVVLADHDPSYEKPVPLTNLPGAGSPEPFGGMRKAYYYPSPEPNPKFAYDGDTYVQVVEFTPQGAVAKALIGYGNASRRGSPHITDQVSYYEQKQLRAVYRTRGRSRGACRQM